MKTSKEEIVLESLKLFAEKGFDAVSTGMIAEQLGITKGALYRHFESKQAIFDAIIEKMFALDAERANESKVPEKEMHETPEAYQNTDIKDLCNFAVEQFSFWTEKMFPCLFRRMITLEQFKSEKMNRLYQDMIAMGPVHYTADLLHEMLKNGQLKKEAASLGPYNLAIQLFAPLQLSIQLFDGGEDAEKLKNDLKRITRDFEERWINKKERNAMNGIKIRKEQETEYREVENLVRESFWNVYRPGCYEHFVLHKLRNDPDFVPELDMVMTLNGKLIGQVIFMKAKIKTDDGREIPICTMGPICITPELKRKGYGKILLDHSLEKAREYGFGAICFEGNIDFYSKSGMTYASSFGIRYHGLPEDEDASFFLCKELQPGYLKGITGEYATPAGYFVDDAAVEEFDKQFPAKEKLKLPGQLFG